MKKTYTVFCQDTDDHGTTWINTIEADSVDDAIHEGHRACAEAWGQELDTVHVLGVAEGEVDILHWQDIQS